MFRENTLYATMDDFSDCCGVTKKLGELNAGVEPRKDMVNASPSGSIAAIVKEIGLPTMQGMEATPDQGVGKTRTGA